MNRHNVLPPIGSPSRVSDWIEEELKEKERLLKETLASLDRSSTSGIASSQERFAVCQKTFEEVIQCLPALKSTLYAVKKEYESYIATLERGHEDASIFSQQLRGIAYEEQSQKNVVLRCNELRRKIAIIRKDNQRLLHQLDSIRTQRRAHQHRIKQLTRSQASSTDLPVITSAERATLVDVFTLEKSIDINFLTKKAEELRKEVNYLEMTEQVVFVPHEEWTSCQQQFRILKEERRLLAKQGEMMKHKLARAQASLEIIKDCSSDSFTTPNAPLLDIITATLSDPVRSAHYLSYTTPQSQSSLDEDDSPDALQCIDEFNELIKQHRFEEAACVAAGSYKGVLRTLHTMELFRKAHHRQGDVSPWSIYCEALTCAASLSSPLSVDDSRGCVQCALEEGKLDNITHWLAQQKLSASMQMGNIILDYSERQTGNAKDKAVCLAEKVFAKCKAHKQVCLCLAKRHQPHLMVKYITLLRDSKFTMKDLEEILLQNPSMDLVDVVTSRGIVSGHFPLTLSQVLLLFLRNGKAKTAESIAIAACGPSYNNFISAVVSDRILMAEDWQELQYLCEKAGLYDLALEVLASSVATHAVVKALRR